MLNHVTNAVKTNYLYILFPHGGAVATMDPHNEQTAYGKRDSPGDLLLIVVPAADGTLDDCKSALQDYQTLMFDQHFSPQYYPGHANSIGDPADVKVAYYDYQTKPWLYEKLQGIKTKYDPHNLLRNPLTIPPLSSSSTSTT